MGQKLQTRIGIWKKLLLDFGKRNRLINFREENKNNIRVTMPEYETIYDMIVVNEREVVFPYAKKVRVDEEGEEVYETVVEGDVKTNKSIGDLQKILKKLRYKANISIEERGINTLYLTLGMLRWKEQDNAPQAYSSPIILIPVRLVIESITSPYRLVLHDDEIVVNPTLSHKMDNDFGIVLPEFDGSRETPGEYLDEIARKVENKGWYVDRSVYVSNLSFLKINMYKDLERNEGKLNSNPVIAALAGEGETVPVPEEFNGFDHDRRIRPVDTFQVVDADSSQQDAVLLSKKGVSFVLQGPPGTGKSQTITNIIAEAIAEGRKILFVSEKMAALQVVYNRLASVGLADFCFTLHSHKAKKKEILHDLANSIGIDRTRVREEALAQLDLLERKRDTLNDYQEELHAKTSALGISIFTVNGRLAKLEDVPNVVFPISDVGKTTQEQLNERLYLLGEMSETMEKRSEKYSDNVWRKSTVRSLSNALRHDIDSNISQALPLLRALGQLHSDVCGRLGINLFHSLSGSEILLKVADIAARSPMVPEEWVLSCDVRFMKKEAELCEHKFDFVREYSEKIRKRYDESIFGIDAARCKRELTSLIGQLQKLVNGDENQIVADIESIYQDVALAVETLSPIFSAADVLASKLEMAVPDSFGKLSLFVDTVRIIGEARNVKPAAKWFDPDALRRVKLEMESHVSLHESVQKAREKILSRFDKEIFDYDFYPTLKKFRGEYDSFFKFMKPDYHRDCKEIGSFLTKGGGLSYGEILDLLNDLKFISDSQAQIDDNEELYRDCYGEYYEGLKTRWDIVSDAIGRFEAVIGKSYFITPAQMRQFIEGSIPYAEIVQFNLQTGLDSIEETYTRLTGVLRHKFTDSSPYSDIKVFAEKVYAGSARFIEIYGDIQRKALEPFDFPYVVHNLELLESVQKWSNDIRNNEESIKEMFGQYYNGADTDWGKLADALDYASEFKEVVEKHKLSDMFVRAVCTDPAVISYCVKMRGELEKCWEKLAGYVEWFVSLFENGRNFYHYKISVLADKMSACMNNTNLLEEWVDYCANRDKCKLAGLGEYIDEVEKQNVDSKDIVDAYLKRFYRLWLDDVLPDFPAVQDFRGRTHSQTVAEFCKLDKEQFKISRARVREKALSRMPDFNSVNGARDEIAILKRELNKQRGIMPLRKLFRSIPNLLTSLRPCFMMSPLSVSIFLEAESYDFDLVIFDEASQVHTEDAIGAIMRGKQVIIVGDTRQLPPTSFFTASLNDDDFDVDSETSADEADVRGYESILDESMAILPERSLRWHYRSRHEHLIAFSNVKIYNGQLITFPSTNELAKDCGVEYVYVSDGVYDRGGKKNNVVEARKVADLVFEHFRNHPGRSLGVVTFSESQQAAVDAAILQRRLLDSSFDSFFQEDKEEPFFIKNLENVQGDERDTIIFSIGYAKDPAGVMHMNFGPLSREGGYRRLNVAITRAKYNVKLVGSILPADIKLEKVSTDGVRMLRSYMEFARQGVSALKKELAVHGEKEFDSAFEESVCEFLRSKGYDVATRVGCSGFRIDMAVRHPVLHDKFVIGIECDGLTYHSSRTVRERDRLRREVLEGMGWTTYRIWSTDWIKAQKTEKRKLVRAIERAIGNNVTYGDVYSDKNVEEEEDEICLPTVEIEEKAEPRPAGYGFDFYKRAKILGEGYVRMSEKETILSVISVEQPVHFEELCKRVAPFYGRQKVTSSLREDVMRIVQSRMRKKVAVDDAGFFTIVGFTDVRARVADPEDDYVRPFPHICDAELATAMKAIARQSFGITPHDLIAVTAHEFGCKRMNVAIMTRLRRIYARMLENNEVTEPDGKVHVAG